MMLPGIVDSGIGRDVTWDTTQSPHWLGMTVPVESVPVAHQGTGESA